MVTDAALLLAVVGTPVVVIELHLGAKGVISLASNPPAPMPVNWRPCGVRAGKVLNRPLTSRITGPSAMEFQVAAHTAFDGQLTGATNEVWFLLRRGNAVAGNLTDRCAPVCILQLRGSRMKRLLLIVSFLLAACDGGNPITPSAPNEVPAALSVSNTCTLANGNTAERGFDEYGYNRCAHIFNGTFEGWCAAKGQVPDCAGVAGSTNLIMKWNEEWDRGNATGWTAGPYAANLDNETRGTYLDGTPFSEHFMTRWDAGCVASGGTESSNGGQCIWGQFEILMDQGTEAGEHLWWAKLTPAGYGN